MKSIIDNHTVAYLVFNFLIVCQSVVCYGMPVLVWLYNILQYVSKAEEVLQSEWLLFQTLLSLQLIISSRCTVSLHVVCRARFYCLWWQNATISSQHTYFSCHIASASSNLCILFLSFANLVMLLVFSSWMNSRNILVQVFTLHSGRCCVILILALWL